MDEIDKNIELGILQGKSLKYCEPHEYIRGANVINEIPLNKLIKWYRKQQKLGLHKSNKYYTASTMDFLVEYYIVHWAWIE